jgi:hypothetical protein
VNTETGERVKVEFDDDVGGDPTQYVNHLVGPRS